MIGDRWSQWVECDVVGGTSLLQIWLEVWLGITLKQGKARWGWMTQIAISKLREGSISETQALWVYETEDA
jgi:hypothetical protein